MANNICDFCDMEINVVGQQFVSQYISKPVTHTEIWQLGSVCRNECGCAVYERWFTNTRFLLNLTRCKIMRHIVTFTYTKTMTIAWENAKLLPNVTRHRIKRHTLTLMYTKTMTSTWENVWNLTINDGKTPLHIKYTQ